MVGLGAESRWLLVACDGLLVAAEATALGIATRAARATPASAKRAFLVPGFSGVRMTSVLSLMRWERVAGRESQALAGEPGQGEVGDFAPAVVEDE